MAQLIDLGKLRFDFVGDYNGSTVYERNDCVKYGGNLYVYVNQNNASGILPTVTTHWGLMVEGINFRGAYAGNVAYAVGDVVAYGGIAYICTTTTTAGTLPTVTANWEKFIDGLQYEGAYNNATSYQKNDIVTYGARAYIAKQTTVGNLPTDTANWDLFTDGTAVTGAWSSATEYKKNDIVTYGGVAYVALRDTVDDNPATSASDWAVLVDGLRHRGAWVTGTAYFPRDLVTRGSYVYLATTAHTAAAAFSTDLNATRWTVFSGGFRWRGAWGPEVPYLRGDVVTDGNSSYVANSDFTSGVTTILDDADWTVIAAGADYLPAQVSNADKLLTTDGTDPSWTADIDINSAKLDTELIVGGTNAQTFHDNLTQPTITVVRNFADDYAQIAFKNTGNGTSSSTDFIAYTNNGNDDEGFIDMGITSAAFEAAEFGITGPHDGYIFMQAPAGSTGNGDLVFATGDGGVRNAIVFAAGGFTSGTEQMTIIPDDRVHIEIDTDSTNYTTGALTVAGGVGITGNLNVNGDVNINGDIELTGLQFLAVGNTAQAFAETLVNPVTVFTIDADDDYAQVAFKNEGNGVNSSTDFIAYANNGSDESGYIDMGITSSAFNDPDFTITGVNDGYIFMEAPIGTTGRGDLVLATSNNGTRNAIVFAAGGLASDDTQMVIIPDQSVHIEIDTESSTSTNGALTVAGGIGLTGNLNVGGNVGIQGNVDIQGQITIAGGGTTFDTANLAVVDPMIYVAQGNPDDVVDFALVGEEAVDLGSPLVASIATRALTSDEATITTVAAHGFQIGDYVVIAGMTGASAAVFNGTHRITATPTTTTFRFAKVNANVTSAAADGTATVSARAQYAGIARDASDKKFKLFDGVDTKPSNTVNFGQATYSTLVLGTVEADTDVKVNNSSVLTKALYDAKGDLIVASAGDTPVRLPVGADTRFIQADSGQTTGLKYTSLATDKVLGAITLSTSSARPASPDAGQFTYETDTNSLFRYTGTAWRKLGSVFFGLAVDADGNLTATVGPDNATYTTSDYLDYAILPDEVDVQVNSAGELLLIS